MAKPIKRVRRKGRVKKVVRLMTRPEQAIDPQEVLYLTGLPVPIANPPSQTSTASFLAQILGQRGKKRSIRGGIEILTLARNSYMQTEWSGKADRRKRRGRMMRTLA
jgi:hypothetical protein